MFRRAFIEGLLAGGASLAVGATAAAEAAEAHRAAPGAAGSKPERGSEAAVEPQAASAEQLWPLLAPLVAGDPIGLGWSVLGLAGVAFGGAVLTLVNGQGVTARVHLCRRSAGSRPIAHSDSVDFFLMNDGDGSAPTDESLGRVLNVLATLTRHNEAAGAQASEAMLSHEARLRFYRAERALV
jgi:hypothetical protein